MSKRSQLKVAFSDEERREIEELAGRLRVTMAQAIRMAIAAEHKRVFEAA